MNDDIPRSGTYDLGRILDKLAGAVLLSPSLGANLMSARLDFMLRSEILDLGLRTRLIDGYVSMIEAVRKVARCLGAARAAR